MNPEFSDASMYFSKSLCFPESIAPLNVNLSETFFPKPKKEPLDVKVR